jgi:transketolase
VTEKYLKSLNRPTTGKQITVVLQPKFYTLLMPSLQETATQIRRDIVRMVHGAASGHPGGSLGCTEYFTALYFKVMKHNPKFNMDATNEDVFILSNGHISPVFYSTLARAGYLM